jgi:serine/threonine protein kinase
MMTTTSDTVSAAHDISEIIGDWREGGRPSTKAVLRERPELRDCASVVVQLAHEEYCLRREAGETVGASIFCDNFPTIRGKLRQLLEVEDALFDLPLDEPEEIDWPKIGSVFLDFELLSMLGVGAAARVYLARQRNLGNRYVALKVSRFGGSEAEILGKLQHPHVVPIFSVHFDRRQELTAVCMPYLGGATLLDIRLRAFRDGTAPRSVDAILEAARKCEHVGEFVRGEAPANARLLQGSYVDGVVHMIAELADGLAYTHEHQIMHRDLKPSNVLVTPQGKPMLLDFNLSWDADLEISRLGGTLPYMPSEQIYATFFTEEAPLTHDPRADIFSLGVILYELLTGHLPFPTTNSTSLESLHNLLAAHSAGVPDIRQHNPDVSPALARLVESCLDPVLDMRPPTAADLAAQLRDLLPLTSDPNTRSEVQVRRRRGIWHSWRTTAMFLTLATPLGLSSLNVWDWKVDERFPIASTNNKSSADASSADASSVPVAPIATRPQVMQEAWELAASESDFERILGLLERAEQLETGPSLTPHKAYCHFRLGDLEKAISLLSTEVAGLEAVDPDLLNNLGYCHLKRMDIHPAKQSFERALAADPNHPQANLNRALCNLQLEKIGYQDPDFGVSFAERAVDAMPTPDPTVYLEVARVYAWAATHIVEMRQLSNAKIEEYLDAARQLGLPADVIRRQREFQHLHRHRVSWFVAIVDQSDLDETSSYQASTTESFVVIPSVWE